MKHGRTALQFIRMTQPGLGTEPDRQIFDEWKREGTENAMEILVIFRSLRKPRAAPQTLVHTQITR